MARYYHYDGLAPEQLTEIACPVCLGRAGDPIADDNGFTIQRCRTPDCGFVYVNPRPDAAQLARFYDRYYDPDAIVPEKWGREMQDLFEECRGWLCAERPTGTVLDVGCSFGHFLQLMEREGWRTVGIEPSPVAADHARRTLAGRVLEMALEDAELEPAHFDAVVSLYVLEHVTDPRAFVERIFTVLKPGGLAVLRVPYTAPLFPVQKLLRRPLLFAPMHLNDFSPAALERLARSVGFRRVEAHVGRSRRAHDLLENVGARVLGGLGRVVERATRRRVLFPFVGALSYRLWK
jgi:SAM-dependent methyltransferase